MYGFLNEKQQSRLDIALAGTREESRLIANLLDLARIQEGKATLVLGHGDICKVIHDVVSVFRYDAMQMGITVAEDFPLNESFEINADTGKIKQVVTNLISNALKFTTEGGSITIYLRTLNGQIEIRVKDTGIGIPEEEYTKIFDRFYQVDSSLTRKVGGTGIGLNIAKEYVEMHGGKIWVESRVGAGSTFIFTIPISIRAME
jgi:signal transduction histidine kinase